jgi:hypothetical protein
MLRMRGDGSQGRGSGLSGQALTDADFAVGADNPRDHPGGRIDAHSGGKPDTVNVKVAMELLHVAGKGNPTCGERIGTLAGVGGWAKILGLRTAKKAHSPVRKPPKKVRRDGWLAGMGVVSR